MTKSRISVVIPSFNQAVFLERTIRSVIAQAEAETEVFVMDGGSQDGSVDIIRNYEQSLTFWQSKPDGGQAAAIAAGFARATGDVLCWVNSDDLLLPGALARVGRFFAQRPSVECAVGGCVFIDSEDRVLKGKFGLPLCYPGLRTTKWQGLAWGFGPNQPATFFRRSAYEDVGGMRSEFRFCLDYDLFLRFAERKPIERIEGWLAAFRVHPQAKSSCLQSIREEEDRALGLAHGRMAKGMAWEICAKQFYRVRGHAAMLPARLAAREWVGLRIDEIDLGKR